MAVIKHQTCFLLQKVILILLYLLGSCGGITWGSGNYIKCRLLVTLKTFENIQPMCNMIREPVARKCAI